MSFTATRPKFRQPPRAPVVSGYVGPGDTQSFLIWGSVARGYSAAYAAPGNNPAFTIVDSSGANSTVINVLSTGLTDTAAVSAFIGLHGTPSVTKLWDQSGAGNHWTQATVANMPTLSLSAINSLPTMVFVAANSMVLKSGTFAAVAQPFTFLAVAKRTTAINGNYLASNDSDVQLGGTTTANETQFYAAGNITSTAGNDNLFHVSQGASVSGAFAATLNIDGATQAVGSATGAIGGTGILSIGAYPTGIQYTDCSVSEVGVYGAAYNSSVQSNTRTAYGL